MLDLDQLRTFAVIVECGSFTRTAELVNKTQSAVSMQMRRLEEAVGKPLFVREGRQSRLTENGERLVHYARRMIDLNNETMAAFDDSEVSGMVRLGTPDDYADRFLPEILARFSRSNPKAEVSVACMPTEDLIDLMQRDALDVSIVTHVRRAGRENEEIIRREPLLWVASARRAVELDPVLPLAVGRPMCGWRNAALSALESVGRDYRVLISSWSSTAVGATVLAGIAVSVLPESALRSGMRVLSEAEGFPPLPMVEIALMRSMKTTSRVADALSEHIVSSLGNLSVPVAAE